MYQLFCTLAPLCVMFCCENSMTRRRVSVLYGIWIYLSELLAQRCVILNCD